MQDDQFLRKDNEKMKMRQIIVNDAMKRGISPLINL
jgi:hypothetical protein